GLDQGRVAALGFDIAFFFDFYGDHLDFHGSMEADAAAKAERFAWPGRRCRVSNRDDECGRRRAGEEQDAERITDSRTDSAAFLEGREARGGDAGSEAARGTPHGEG
ncbi:Mur ligase family protein, partial [Pseudomonas aeruginosa]|uniref:Mur ligase family protein n=1 Tax=Pseudomonas aeruginosa TaxID=287 RepID=UPI0012882BAB